MNEEGWFIDPYGRHDARWMSVGTPTALVRDGSVESSDEPPDAPFPRPLQPVEQIHPHDGSDLKRADDAEAVDFDPTTLTQAASDAIDGVAGF
jgi:hypothetical protein